MIFDFSLIFEMLGKIFLAAVLGMLIGAEREHRHKSAGLRTYTLVAIGSTLFTLLSVKGGMIFEGEFGYDPSRIASQIVIGIGFLGAGLMFFKKDRIRGLTSAAGVWVTAAIGMAVGMGFGLLAVFVTLLVIAVLLVLDFFKDKVDFI